MKGKGQTITILGGGSWGTALSVLLHDAGHRVSIWELFVERAAAMMANRENREMLPGIHIPDDILITPDADRALAGSDVIVFVIPSHGMRKTAETVARSLTRHQTVVIATKGIEENTLMRMSEIVEQVAGVEPGRVAVLVGPSHAEEVSRGVPTTVVAASKSEHTADTVRDIFMTPRFRVYTNTDVVGVEAGVALKNVVAIAAGMCDGLGYGDNTKGALLTRGLAEMSRLGIKMGARPETFSGLAGIGDLITTCVSKHSRNRYVGEEIGKGRTLDDVLSGMVMVAEGVRTTRSAVGLAERYKVEMPIASEVYKILFEDKSAEEAINDLMLRTPKPEVWQ
ncbi:MAG: NAD(P)H-dependent glycerol-3-phosphate dehydrogenase [Candidatus Eisenbacteria bacterium]